MSGAFGTACRLGGMSIGIGLALGLGMISQAFAADLPRRSASDARIGYVTYAPDQVFVIKARRGVVTRIILEPGETITRAGTGLASDCANDGLEWCIRADEGTDQIWVKPRSKADSNNLELATSKRNYSLRFEATGLTGKGTDEFYRVIFQYPIPKIPLPAALLAPGVDGRSAPLAGLGATPNMSAINQRLAQVPEVRNTQYSMSMVGGGELIAPSMAFDDGRFTYLRFASNREIPAPFFFGADNSEARVNFHMDGDFMVLHRTAPKFVLRLGDAVVGIWNDAFDPDGVATPSGTVVPGVIRAIK